MTKDEAKAKLKQLTPDNSNTNFFILRDLLYDLIDQSGAGGGSLTSDQLAAINGAASPSASNVFATADDLWKYRGKRTFSGTTDTLVLADAGGLVTATNNGSITITVPPQSGVAFPELVTITCFPNSSNGQITFAPGSGVTLLSGGGALKTAMPLGGVALTLIDAATNTWWVEGNLTV